MGVGGGTRDDRGNQTISQQMLALSKDGLEAFIWSGTKLSIEFEECNADK